MTIDTGEKLFKDLEEIIVKHYTAMQDEVVNTKNKDMIEIFPSVFIQMLINEFYRTTNPVIVTATILTILTQKVVEETNKVVH